MKTTTELLRLFQVARLKPSVNGNPRWEFSAWTATGELREVRTASDVSSGYACDLSRLNVTTSIVRVSHHETRTGNLIADQWGDSRSTGADLRAQFEAEVEAAELARSTPVAPGLDTTKRL